MDKPAADVKAEAEQPKDDKNDDDRPKHNECSPIEIEPLQRRANSFVGVLYGKVPGRESRLSCGWENVDESAGAECIER